MKFRISSVSGEIEKEIKDKLPEVNWKEKQAEGLLHYQYGEIEITEIDKLIDIMIKIDNSCIFMADHDSAELQIYDDYNE